MSPIASHGNAWGLLERQVDPVIEDLMNDFSIPGLTLAITRGGALLLEKGYGHARIDLAQKIPAGPRTRFKIGSVTKACITGPTGFRAMHAADLDPAVTRLYGPAGIFGGRFDGDIETALQVFAPQPGLQQARRAWYRSITVQHLLDHDAGFANSGSPGGAAELFGIPAHEVTYEHIHSHFLRTKALKYQPGTAAEWKAAGPDRDPYSNHGFGLWTLLIQVLTGRPYLEYVQEQHLRPLGLRDDVLPERHTPDTCDAGRYTASGDGPVRLVPFKDSGRELAAGGFMASARALVAITRHLVATYSGQELARMGWRSDPAGKLAHNGAAAGMKAYVAMFPDGYVIGGTDVGRTHVAVAANTDSLTTSDLRRLVNTCAQAVTDSRPPASFDLWDGTDRAPFEYLPVPTGAHTIRQKSSRRFVDAHESSASDFSVVTREDQNNGSQRWRFTPVAAVYTIRQVSSGRLLDAYEHTEADFSVVTRSPQDNDTQRWVAMHAVGNRSTYTLQQVSSGRLLDAHERAGADFSAVTRAPQDNHTQQWVLAPQADGTLTVMQRSSGRFLDAYATSGEDFSAVTRAAQDNETQRWRFVLVGTVYTIQQVSSGRFLDAHEDSTADFSVVTRSAQTNGSQRWIHLSGGTLQQLSSARLLDAHEHAGQDFSVVTRTRQDNDTQRWFID